MRTRTVGGATTAALALVTAAVLATGSAPAADTPPLPGAPESLLSVGVGGSYVKLAMFAPTGSLVRFFEEVPGGEESLGEATAAINLGMSGTSAAYAPVPIPWRCDRTVRVFRAVAIKDGKTVEATNEGRTPDCRDRISVVAPARVEPGQHVSITLKDRWQLGDLKVRVCTLRHGSPRRCSKEHFRPGQRAVRLSRDAGRSVGLMDIDVTVARFHEHQQVGIGRPAPKVERPRLLVAGDSIVQGIGAILAEKLKSKYLVSSVIRSGTGVAKTLGTPWTVLARQQAAKLKPAVTAVMIGGSDANFPMTTASGGKVECCGEPWRVEYLRRIEAMAAAWSRGGQGKVVWALLPATKYPQNADGIAAVNDAIRRLAAKHPEVRLVPLDSIFGTTYQEDLNGVRVRDPDGLHFSLAGQRIAAEAFLKALRG